MDENGTMFQYFEWHLDSENLWRQLKDDAGHLKELGVSSVWIPPCYKATSPFDPGYGTYDLYDLGEFDQKGAVRTKYGEKKDLLEAIDALHGLGIAVYADAVLNHKASGDEKERFTVVEVDPNDRTRIISDPFEIEGWTRFTFPGRGDQHSAFKWNWQHFSGVDLNAENDKPGIYMIQGTNKGWSEGVDKEKGNFDFLMFNDIDYKHPDVVEEIKNWGRWFVNETHVDGMRFDAAKHIIDWFLRDFLNTLRAEHGDGFYAVAEYWKDSAEATDNYMLQTDFGMDLFDVPLHFNLMRASRQGKDYDLSSLFNSTLVAEHKELAVTFVDNHDSQPGQAMESFVEAWFKPLAYGLILLREDGYPCIFYGDYYGIRGEHPIDGHREIIDKLLYLRNNHAYGSQDDYLDHPNCIGWVRRGNEEHPFGCAVLMSNGDAGEKQMHVGDGRQGEVWADFTGNHPDKTTIDENGHGVFKCSPGSISVYVKDGITPKEAFHPQE